MESLKPEIAFAGRNVTRKILLALALCGVIPLLILAYAIYAYLMPMLDPVRQSREVVWVQALLGFTGLLMAAGGFVMWDLARAVTQTADVVTGARDAQAVAAARTDEMGILLDSFSRMLGTVEQQADAINDFTARLEGAYRDLEVTNTRLREASFKDEVTGLYNRRFFTIRLEEEVSRYRRFNHPVSVVLIDLDGFKAVNDELGHRAGDDTLRGVADLLLRQSRGINVICRYGGDEFAVLLVETSRAGARAYAERVRYLLSERTYPHGRRITASLGLASLPEDVGPAPEELVRAADEALYAAKRAGKNRVTVYEAAEAVALAGSGPSPG